MAGGALRRRVTALVDGRSFQYTVVAVIVLNGILLGAATYERELGPALAPVLMADRVCVAVFVVELTLRIYARPRAFFAGPWNWFDLVVVGAALVPASSGLAVLRLLRPLRLLRMINVVPQMRGVVSAMFRAVPGLSTVIGLLFVVMYTAAVLGELLFHEVAPRYFGDLGTTLYTLFMLLTTENWPDISDAVIPHAPQAWIFFVVYIVVTAFIVLNLIIGVIVTSMEHEFSAERWRADQELEEAQHMEVMARLAELTEEVTRLRARLERSEADGRAPGRGDA